MAKAFAKIAIGAAFVIGAFAIGTEIVATEPSEQVRLDFEQRFQWWVSAMDVADQCGTAQFDEAKVTAISQQAASAFYPGLRNILQRSEYMTALGRTVPQARAAHSGGFIVRDCSKSVDAATLARWPVEAAVERAAVHGG